MGNENSSSDSNTNKNKPVLNQKQKQKQKQTQNKLQHKSYDEFFINHHKLYSLSHTIDVSLINPKRIVFISIIGLYRSWKCCPSILLYNAIIITPLKKDWIMQPDAYRHEYNYMLQNEQFLTLLRWKEHQKLAIFLVDNDDDDDDINDGINSSNSSSSSSSLPSHSDSKETSSKKSETQSTLYGEINEDGDYSIIAPVWRRLSLLLQELHDPIGNNKTGKYNPLIFNEKYWRKRSSISKYKHSNRLFQNMSDLHIGQINCINVEDILLELYTVTMRFATIKHILIESNPTLEIITNYFIPINKNNTNNNIIILYPSPNTSNTSNISNISNVNNKIAIEKQIENVNKKILVTPQISIINISEYNSEIEYKYENKNDSDEPILDDNWWIADDYYDNNMLYEDNKAINEFDEIMNEIHAQIKYEKKNKKIKETKKNNSIQWMIK